MKESFIHSYLARGFSSSDFTFRIGPFDTFGGEMRERVHRRGSRDTRLGGSHVCLGVELGAKSLYMSVP